VNDIWLEVFKSVILNATREAHPGGKISSEAFLYQMHPNQDNKSDISFLRSLL
jgi:hypothetical protein